VAVPANEHLSEQFNLAPVRAADSPLVGGRVYHGAWGRHNGDVLGGSTLDAVHFGTPQAAEQRMSNTYDPEGSEDITMWSGEIHPDATVYPEPLTDAQQADLAHAVEFGGADLPADVVPYVNDYEDPGSVSFMLRRGALTRLRPQEWWG
jgi:hypothetical protein